MLKEAMAEKSRMVPKTGYNLVGVDDFEPVGSKLYVISHHDTESEANAALERRKKSDPDETCYVYGPGTK